MNGILGLDIDGTLTHEAEYIPTEIVKYLEHLHDEGWEICLLTGRPFSFAYAAVKAFPFPYYLAIHNGATLLKMPEREILFNESLSNQILYVMDRICWEESTDYVIYGGVKHEDRSYYRPSRFSAELLEYLKWRQELTREHWVEVDSFEGLPCQDFIAVKAFGDFKVASRISEKVTSGLGLYTPVIRDAFHDNLYISQATRFGVNKGEALLRLRESQMITGSLIVAGDDQNDLPMFQVADFSIAMPTATDEVQEQATVVSRPVEEFGVISSIEQAIERLRRSKKREVQ